MSEVPVVLILAAGLGTRMKSDRAKVLHTVCGRPLIVWATEGARAAAADRTIAIVGHQADEVTALLTARYGEGEVETVMQSEQRGTGHAVQCALPALGGEPDDRIVVIVSADAPLLLPSRIGELTAACREAGGAMAMLSAVAPDPTGYGRVIRDSGGALAQIVEHADASEAQRAVGEINAGFYAVRLGELRADLAALSTDNAQGELYLTDVARSAAARGPVAVLEVPYDEIAGVNTRLDLARVEASARSRRHEQLMAEGVTLQAPEQTFIDADAGPFGRDVTIAAGAHIRGRTSVGDGAVIDTGAVLADVVVGDGAWIKPHSVLTDTVLGPKVQIGPFAHCRPGTVVDDGAKVGNFVETKKAHIMPGAKASHLAYLGDVSVGAGANIGAGTITCNYDGFRKHQTTIEAGAFIGSDSQLVAPVTVGRDAYVGSGTTVTKDVPRSSLALSRVKQVNIEGWADRFRAANEKRKKKRD